MLVVLSLMGCTVNIVAELLLMILVCYDGLVVVVVVLLSTCCGLCVSLHNAQGWWQLRRLHSVRQEPRDPPKSRIIHKARGEA